MLILDENNHTIVIDSVTTPLLTEYFWVLDLEQMDYTLTPVLMLEEIIASSITVEINGFQFTLPGDWNMLVYSEETMQLDVVEIGDLAGADHTALIYGPDKAMVEGARVAAVDLKLEYANYTPSLPKHTMLCHPIGPNEWINVAPSDVYNKYLKDCVAGDII